MSRWFVWDSNLGPQYGRRRRKGFPCLALAFGGQNIIKTEESFFDVKNLTALLFSDLFSFSLSHFLNALTVA